MTWEPDWAVHPGEILREVLEETGLSVRVAAVATGLPEADLAALVERRASITEDAARRLERLSVTWRMWMALQEQYDAARRRGAPDGADHEQAPG